MVVVDLSVPRNVDAAVAHVPGVRLVDVEAMHDDPTTDPDLHAVLDAADVLVTEAAQQHVDRVNARRAGPVIAAIRRQVEHTCLQQLTAAAPPTTDPDELARTAHATAGKLLHGPTIAARAAAAAGDSDTLRALCTQFHVRPTGSTHPDALAELTVPEQGRPLTGWIGEPADSTDEWAAARPG